MENITQSEYYFATPHALFWYYAAAPSPAALLWLLDGRVQSGIIPFAKCKHDYCYCRTVKLLLAEFIAEQIGNQLQYRHSHIPKTKIIVRMQASSACVNSIFILSQVLSCSVYSRCALTVCWRAWHNVTYVCLFAAVCVRGKENESQVVFFFGIIWW